MATWTVPAAVTPAGVHDGDTVHLALDLAWHTVTWTGRARVAGINAPELATPEGVTARDYAAALLPAGTAVTVTTGRFDNYGRPLVTIRLPDGRDFGQLMLTSGHAAPWPAPAVP